MFTTKDLNERMLPRPPVDHAVEPSRWLPAGDRIGFSIEIGGLAGVCLAYLWTRAAVLADYFRQVHADLAQAWRSWHGVENLLPGHEPLCPFAVAAVVVVLVTTLVVPIYRWISGPG
jgi:hypothetical protein